MNIQKKDTKLQCEIIHKDRGDMIRRRKEVQGSTPRERGDTNRNKKSSKQVLFKTTKSEKAESSKVSELVSRSTNTLTESAPGSFKSRAKIGTASCERSVDFRKIIKERYTFRRQQKVDTKDGDSKINDVKKEPPKPSDPESSSKNKSKDSVKNGAKIKDKVAVHRAVSAMKVKPIKPTLADRIKDTAEIIRNCHRKDRHRKPVIQTITSKVDKMRVYKAVTFVEKVQRQPLHITIPNKDPRPKAKSRIPVSVPKTQSVKRVAKRLKLQRRSSTSSGCLPTEVAQWAPESITQHTIPYYEAWLSKTATASTKYSKEERESILRSKALTPRSPVEYNLEDAGRIRVRRKVK